MEMKYFPTIDLEATGKHIAQLRKERGLSVKDLQNYFGFDAPQAIYKWQKGTTLPSVDNLLALSVLLEVSIDSILVTNKSNITLLTDCEPEGSVFLRKFQGQSSQSIPPLSPADNPSSVCSPWNVVPPSTLGKLQPTSLPSAS